MRISAITLCLFSALAPAQPPRPGAPEWLRQGQALARQGKIEEALALYRQEIEKNPSSSAAHSAAGVALDLLGRTAEARSHFQKAVDAAPDDQARAAAWRQMSMSYAFDNDCSNAVKYGQMVFDYWAARGNYYSMGESANEMARVCIEAGDFDTAERLYRTGTESGLKEPEIAPARAALWKFRWEHAQARLAARRGRKQEALEHTSAARAILDANPDLAKTQAIFFPYLAGYVALYTGEPARALEELRKANQSDPFIQCLIGLAHERLGHKEEALASYRTAAQTTAHNPPAAFARPFARKKLAAP